MNMYNFCLRRRDQCAHEMTNSINNIVANGLIINSNIYACHKCLPFCIQKFQMYHFAWGVLYFDSKYHRNSFLKAQFGIIQQLCTNGMDPLKPREIAGNWWSSTLLRH